MLDSRSYLDILQKVAGLEEMVKVVNDSERPEAIASAVEFILEGLYVNRKLNKTKVEGKTIYRH